MAVLEALKQQSEVEQHQAQSTDDGAPFFHDEGEYHVRIGVGKEVSGKCLKPGRVGTIRSCKWRPVPIRFGNLLHWSPPLARLQSRQNFPSDWPTFQNEATPRVQPYHAIQPRDSHGGDSRNAKHVLPWQILQRTAWSHRCPQHGSRGKIRRQDESKQMAPMPPRMGINPCQTSSKTSARTCNCLATQTTKASLAKSTFGRSWRKGARSTCERR